MTYLWIKAFHLIALVTWFAGLFYLPRLFVYHTMSHDEESNKRFKVMERKLYYGITTPGAVVTIALGLWMIHLMGGDWFKDSHWLHAKLLLVLVLVAFHLYCGKLLKVFAQDKNLHSEKFFRLMNEIPVIPLIGIILLAVLKPF